MNTSDHYYRVLDLGPGASIDEVKQAHKEMLKVWHPDRFNNDEELQRKAQEKLKEINNAYDMLSQLPPPSLAQVPCLTAGGAEPALDPPSSRAAGVQAKRPATRRAWMATIFTSVACAIFLSSFTARRISSTPAGAAPPVAQQAEMATGASSSAATATSASPAANCGDCWVQVFDDDNFALTDDHHVICGEGRRADLRNLPGATKLNWGNEIQSLKVGPAASVVVWTVEGFKGITRTFGPGTEVATLKAIPGLTDNISAIEVRCLRAE